MDDIFYEGLEEQQPYGSNSLDLNVSDMFHRTPVPVHISSSKRDDPVKE